MYAAMADMVAAGDKSYMPALNALWKDAATRKTYITGGAGGVGYHESFYPPWGKGGRMPQADVPPWSAGPRPKKSAHQIAGEISGLGCTETNHLPWSLTAGQSALSAARRWAIFSHSACIVGSLSTFGWYSNKSRGMRKKTEITVRNQVRRPLHLEFDEIVTCRGRVPAGRAWRLRAAKRPSARARGCPIRRTAPQ